MSFADIFDVNSEPDDVVPAGSGYALQIDGVRLQESAAGKPTALVVCRVVGGAAPPTAVGRSFRVFFALEGPGVAYLTPMLKACGLERVVGQVTFEASELVGKKIVADVAIDRPGDASFYRVRNPMPSI